MLSNRSCRIFLLLLVLVTSVVAGPELVSAQQPPRTADEEFVPIDELPPDEKLPAAPFVIAAYSVAWIIVAGYLWSIRQRLGRVERDISEVFRRVPQAGPAAPPARTRDMPAAPKPGSGGAG